MIKSILSTLLIFALDGLVYYKTIITKINNPIINNTLTIYFLYYIIVTLLLLIGCFTISICLKNLEKTKIVTTKVKKMISKKYTIQKYLKFFIHIGFGIIGAWKFFIIGIIYSLSEFILWNSIKQLKIKIQEISPEIKKQSENGKKEIKINGLKLKWLANSKN